MLSRRNIVMVTLYEVILQSPAQLGDDIIKAQLSSSKPDDFKALDTIINNLRNSYSLDQIYKVYHQNF